MPLPPRRSWAEPFKIKMVEPVRVSTREERERAIAAAGYNTFLLRSADVYIDLLTDSGTSAMSDRQWAGMMLGDEAYAGSVNFYHLEETIQSVYGYKHVIPTHQGRGAEHLISKILIRPASSPVICTSPLHACTRSWPAGASSMSSFRRPTTRSPHTRSRGNFDLDKLESSIKQVGAKNIPYVSMATSVNMAGGQPLSMANLRALRGLTARHGIRILHDATRVAENAYFIQQREPSYADRSCASIVHEICSYTDGATMSAKKDALVNIGGFLALNEWDLFEEARNLVVVYEGLHTYGGLAGRDMEAMAIGIHESVDDDHIRARVGQVQYLGEKILSFGIPIVLPIGGHGVFVDAKRFLPHVAQTAYPAQALAAAIYVDSGVRTMERGAVSAGRNAETGQEYLPSLELVRLTVPGASTLRRTWMWWRSHWRLYMRGETRFAVCA
jgi:tyrosine phenol-lyase